MTPNAASHRRSSTLVSAPVHRQASRLDVGVPGLVTLYGIESPGLTAALADHVRDLARAGGFKAECKPTWYIDQVRKVMAKSERHDEVVSSVTDQLLKLERYERVKVEAGTASEKQRFRRRNAVGAGADHRFQWSSRAPGGSAEGSIWLRSAKMPLRNF